MIQTRVVGRVQTTIALFGILLATLLLARGSVVAVGISADSIADNQLWFSRKKSVQVELEQPCPRLGTIYSLCSVYYPNIR